MSMHEAIQKMLEPLKRRILLMTAKAIVTAINDSGGIQLSQVEALADETQDVERFQDYGLSANPPLGSEALVIFLGGDRSHGVALKVDSSEHRKKGLVEGEVALYTDEDDYAHFKRGRKLHIRTNQWNVQGANDDLMALLISVATECKNAMEKLSEDTTNTMLGPQPLNGFAYYAARKTAIETLITKLTAMKLEI